ncbi:MAG: Flp family type IVb pilin [Firmicutes bacterium]|nr:Flp family type IVb pilin [Bacillota bacterium]
MREILARLVREEDGQGLSEYALIIALVAVLLIGSLLALKKEIASVFTNITEGFKKTE